MNKTTRTALIAALIAAAFSAGAADAPPVKEKTYSAPKDTAFHAAVAALGDVGAQVQKTDFAGGTVMAQTVSRKFMSTKAVNWTVTVEDTKGGSMVHLDRAGFSTYHTTATSDEDPAPYADFFKALDGEVSKRSK